tara:strand:+ start:17084 stop:17620 length:537 start_codon:yes stop_codon:yes gene_type:complete
MPSVSPQPTKPSSDFFLPEGQLAKRTDNYSQEFEPLFKVLEQGHPYQAGKVAEEAIGLCLDTVWKASKNLRAEDSEILNDELMQACLHGLNPVTDIVNALKSNPKIRSSMGLYEGYVTIAGRIESLFGHVKACWPDRETAWTSLRKDVGELLDSMHIQRSTADEIEIARCREKLLQGA